MWILAGVETDFTTRFVQVPGNTASSKIYFRKMLQVVHDFSLSLLSPSLWLCLSLSSSIQLWSVLFGSHFGSAFWWAGAPLLLGSQECMRVFTRSSKPPPVTPSLGGAKICLRVPGFSGSRRATTSTPWSSFDPHVNECTPAESAWRPPSSQSYNKFKAPKSAISIFMSYLVIRWPDGPPGKTPTKCVINATIYHPTPHTE